MVLRCVFIAPRCYLSDGRQLSDGCEPSQDYGNLVNTTLYRVGALNSQINGTTALLAVEGATSYSVGRH